MKQLYRSNINRKIAGVCGGIGEYLSISPDIVRILFIVGALLVGLRYSFIIYIASMLLIPKSPEGYSSYDYNYNQFSIDNIKSKNIIGISLIVLGILMTLKRVFIINDVVVTSIILIALGIYIIVKGGREH